MTAVTTPVPNNCIVLKMPPALEMDDDQFLAFCQMNRGLRIEKTSAGEIVIMSPTGGLTGNRNAKLTQQLGIWTDNDGSGIDFDSSTGFKLSNGANRSPDAAWIKLERWNTISVEAQEKFAPICPDFVVELRSPTDSLATLQTKMAEYIDNGAKLGWLIDRQHRKVYIYHPGVEVEELDNPVALSGESILPGFVLKLEKIW